MNDGREAIKQILIIIAAIALPLLATWIFGAWAAIAFLVSILCLITHYVMKYQG